MRNGTPLAARSDDVVTVEMGAEAELEAKGEAGFDGDAAGGKCEVSSGIRRSTTAKRYFPTNLSRSLMGNDGLMVSVSGIRGRVGEALTPEIVARYAAGFGAWSKRRAGAKARIVLGRDSRVSGPMFPRAPIAALQSVGCDVIDIGLTTPPPCQLGGEPPHAAGGLMISASHNPIEWNALKFI